MNFKEFLKPDLRKIILTIIIFILLLIIIGIPKQYILKCTKTACGSYISIESINLNINASKMSGEMPNLIILGIYLIEVIVGYLISCFLILLIKKLRKGKK